MEKNHRHLCLCLLFFFTLNAIFAQTPPVRKETNAVRTEGSIKVDGILDESDWLRAPLAKDFIQNEPRPSFAASLPTEIRVLYDNTAIYIGAKMYDPTPDSIRKELTLRDEFGNTDVFCAMFDTYRDGNNALNFCVQASGTQCDGKFFPSTDNDDDGQGEDWTWSAVWESAVKIHKDVWVVEMKIPYSALRFPNAPEQRWRVNFGRHIKRLRETNFWNEVNPNLNGFVWQSGEIGGIRDIKPPVRLQAMPFVSGYLQNDFDKVAVPQSAWGRSFTAGMDVKYGINDAFTLDMTLIPDFGQVRSDNKVLNLSPFEVQFDENRQFFTEGVELFNKGNYFYSRRVGAIGSHFYNQLANRLKTGEEIISSPTEAQLYNASKVSGRNKKGLGIGVFNATAAPAYAVVKNTEGVERKEKLSPLTNYNILSFDQNLPNNSFINLINTNVMRSGSDYDANLTGMSFNFKDKKNIYYLAGQGALVNRVFTEKNDMGHAYTLKAGKASGLWRWELAHQLESHDYNPNDLGFLRSPNESGWWLWGGQFRYNTKRFNEWNVNAFVFASQLHKPRVYSDFAIESEGFFLTKKIFGFGYNARFEPLYTHDYFEPRTADFSRYFRYPKNIKIGGFISTDYRKTFATDFGLDYRAFNERGQNVVTVRVSPRIRFNDKISLIWDINIERQANFPNWVAAEKASVGYQTLPLGAIIIGEKEQWEIESTPSVKWSFNHLMGLNIRLRHYWARVRFDQFFILGQKGELLPSGYRGISAGGGSFHDTNFNLFNVDANFTWRFAPGSDMILNWKQNVFGENRDIVHHYFYNARQIFNNPMTNSFSIKVIYFLDYLNFVKQKKQNG